uniref:NADH-ubiquinone oxidoreductase chain 6 n=1 Tax=Physosmaragdina nigrifrons TaxID=1453301 RepID=A0A890CD91_9CUCU|nr:NADH dehydrogenase subunit 6 [Physosmaragdina nigrifrons]QRG29987.1 NADH dehydrogenase subunit 6 [Physosmaragdina nigrifrons]
MLFIMLIMFSIMFCLMKHPLTLGFTLLIQTILIALISGIMNMNFWFSYIVFLIMIGGMLVLFIYMTSIASNEKFKFSYKIAFILSGFLLAAMLLITDPLIPYSLMEIMELKPFNYNKNLDFFMNKYINFPHSMIYLLMVIYLLITLIAIVKITETMKSALRQNF